VVMPAGWSHRCSLHSNGRSREGLLSMCPCLLVDGRCWAAGLGGSTLAMLRLIKGTVIA
jgi:hypothetical protein